MKKILFILALSIISFSCKNEKSDEKLTTEAEEMAVNYQSFGSKISDENALTKEEMIEKIKMETRRYAKRQITWFKRIENIIWLDGLNKTEENVNSIMEVYGV